MSSVEDRGRNTWVVTGSWDRGVDWSFRQNANTVNLHPSHTVNHKNDVRCKKLCSEATIPTKSHALDAGWDLYASEDCRIRRGESETIWTGIAMAIPDGCVGLIWPRSGLAVKRGLDVFAGVIDSGYRGNIGVCLYNSGAIYEIKKGDRIAQMIIHRIPSTRMLEVDELGSNGCDDARGEGGFGSSGS